MANNCDNVDGMKAIPFDVLGSYVGQINLLCQARRRSYIGADKVFSTAHTGWVGDEQRPALLVPRNLDIRQFESGAIVSKCDGGELGLTFRGALLEERGQPEAFRVVVPYLREKGSGILQAFTDFGKTIFALAVAAELGRETIIITHRSHMLRNWRGKIAEFLGLPEEEVGVIGEGETRMGRVTIAYAQSLLSKDWPSGSFDRFGFLIADEVHHYGAEEWQKIPNMFAARYRLGLSATVARNDGLTKVVHAHFGDIAYEAKNRTDEGSEKTLVRLYYDVCYNRSFYVRADGTVNAQAYQKLQSWDMGRNTMLVNEMVKAFKAGRKGFVQSHFVDHSKLLMDLLVIACHLEDIKPPKVGHLVGGATTKAAKAASTEAESADWVFSTFSYTREAISLGHLDTLVWGTSPGDAVQAIGRLRVAAGKKSLLCLDTFESGDYSQTNAKKREDQCKSLGVKILSFRREIVPQEMVLHVDKKMPKKNRSKKSKGILDGC